MNFSAADDRALTRFVQKHDILWDVGNRDYKNTGAEKDKLWTEISKSLNKTGERYLLLLSLVQRTKSFEKQTKTQCVA